MHCLCKHFIWHFGQYLYSVCATIIKATTTAVAHNEHENDILRLRATLTLYHHVISVNNLAVHVKLLFRLLDRNLMHFEVMLGLLLWCRLPKIFRQWQASYAGYQLFRWAKDTVTLSGFLRPYLVFGWCTEVGTNRIKEFTHPSPGNTQFYLFYLIFFMLGFNTFSHFSCCYVPALSILT